MTAAPRMIRPERVARAPNEARARELIAWLGLSSFAQQRCEGLSKGTRQKVALAGALVHEPRLIILDEPFTGLDAASARLVKNVLRERVAEGCSVIMTTHILEEAEHCDRVGILRQAGAGHATLEDTFLALVDTDSARGSIAA